jgi:hypothetical protein
LWRCTHLLASRRTLSRYAGDKAVEDFGRALSSAEERRLHELMADPKPSNETLDGIARLIGQHS